MRAVRLWRHRPPPRTAIVYGLWAAGWALPGLDSVRTTGLVVLGLGFVASASAVVPGFDKLMHGNRWYLVVTSLMGFVAFGGGVMMLVRSSELALGVVMAAMVALWMISTEHHAVLARAGTAAGSPARRRHHGGHRPASVS